MFKFFPVIFLLSISYSVNSQDITDAHAYLSFVGDQFEEISKDMMSYTSAASHGKSARKVEKKRQELILTVKNAETNMRKLKPFNGDHAFRDSVVSYFHINSLVLKEEYAKIVDMEEVAEQSYDMMEAYLLAKEKAGDKLDEAYRRASNQMKIFADSNKITLIENSSKLSQKIDVANKVTQYHNQVYLIFFKSYKDEFYLTEAINKKDISAIEQAKNSLDKHASEGMSLLMKTSAFGNDASLKNACMKVLEFYKAEATKIPGLVDFFLKKENYEKARKAFEEKRESERSQSDIDNYNKMVNEYNAAIGKSNALNNELNKGRATSLNNWNKASDEFLDNQMPTYR